MASALLLASLFASHGSMAEGVKAGSLEITHPYARGTAAGQATSSAYLSISNAGKADRLLSASTPVAAAVELHNMSMDGNVMRMRQVDAVELPTGQAVQLKPGGLHLMLMGLKQPLAAGSHFELTLVFENAGPVKVQVEVAQPGAAVLPKH